MKVYVLMRLYDYEPGELLGVHSTKDKAVAAIPDSEREYGHEYPEPAKYDSTCVYSWVFPSSGAIEVYEREVE